MPGRAYGWRQDKTLEPREAKVLRRIVRDLLAGKSMRAVVEDLNRRGVPTATGRQWSATPLRRLLLHPRMIGYQQDSRGHMSRYRDVGRKPMLERDEWERLRKVLAPNPDRVASAPKRIREAWLTGLAWCGSCGGVMTGKQQGDRPRRYACRTPGRGHVGIGAQRLETEVQAKLIDRIAEHGTDLGGRVAYWSSRAGVEQALRDAVVREETLAREFAAGTITRQALAAGTKAAQARQAELRAALDATPPVVGVTDVTVVDVAAKWATMSPRARRGWAKMLIERVEVSKPIHIGIEWREPFPVEDLAQAWAGVHGTPAAA